MQQAAQKRPPVKAPPQARLAPQRPPSAWTKLHACAAALLKEHGRPLTASSLSSLVVLAMAHKVCIERGFYSQLNGIQLFKVILERLDIATTAENAESMREVALAIAESPLYSSGVNPIVARRLAL